MAKRKISDDSEYIANIEEWKETQHNSLTFDGRIYERGDEIYVKLPLSEQGIRSIFKKYVTPKRGRAYVEVETRKGINRAIRPEDIIRGGRKI